MICPRRFRRDGGTRVDHDGCALRRTAFRSAPFGACNIERKEIVMGLDMLAMTTWDELYDTVDFSVSSFDDLHRWWKHPNLHGWMQDLYYEKGGDQSFNCVNVQLTETDLDRLEADIRSGGLPHTTGFFFGESDGSEVEDDLAFVAKARAAIAEGKNVFYTSWW